MTEEQISGMIENADGLRCIDGEYRIEGRDLMNLMTAILQAATRDAPNFDECVASGQSCNYAPEGRKGEMQCRYCGKVRAAFVEVWAVTVSVNGDDILTIGHNHVSGQDITDEFADVVRTAAAHLLSFVGRGTESVSKTTVQSGIPSEWVAFVQECAGFHGQMVKGNWLSGEATRLLAACDAAPDDRNLFAGRTGV